MRNGKWGVLFLVICFFVLGFVVYQIFGAKIIKEKTSIVPTPASIVSVFPTKTPEEIAIISRIETKKVDILETEISPQSLTVKPHDQVAFYNKTGSKIKVVGENWGNVFIDPEENMTQSFQKPGEFSYKVTGLEKEWEGKVIVK